MAYSIDKKTGTISVYGFEKGIAQSPHAGIANMQAVNISTETGEAMCSYARFLQSQANTTATGTLTFFDGNHVSLSSPSVTAGVWITVTGSTHGGELANGDYYVLSNATGFTVAQLSSSFGGAAASGFTAGLSASFTLKRNMGQIVATATETYRSGSSSFYRYYALDSAGLVWAYDTANEVLGTPGLTWFLSDTATISNATGIAVLNGWVMVFAGSTIWCKPTALLGATPGWQKFSASTVSPYTANYMVGLTNPHFAFVGHQGFLFYTDGNFLGSIFPNTSLITGAANIQSYASWIAPGAATLGTISLISGSLPTTSTSSTRIPAVFFTAGTLPSTLTADTIYYIQYINGGSTFNVYAGATGGSALDIQGSAVGTQYFNTFYPTNASGVGPTSSGGATLTFEPQRINLPAFETSQCIAELGSDLIIGTRLNYLYVWDQLISNPVPNGLVPLAENNVTSMVTVNNMVYLLAGNKGNVYLTNGSTASFAISIPDYCAGVPGDQDSYVEPYFTWGAIMFLRGRVYFSILDQTSIKAGNCGGVWSFIPVQSQFLNQDTGLALRCENQSSYGTYGGYVTAFIPAQTQAAKSPQFWSCWQSSISSPSYGIDFTDTVTRTSAIVETDIIPTGTLFDKKTFSQLEYKLSAPLSSGDTVSFEYRTDSTSAWTSVAGKQTESSTALSGVFPANFEATQWLQVRVTLAPATSSNDSFCRLAQVIIRQ